MSSLAARLDRFVRWFFNCSPSADIDSQIAITGPTLPSATRAVSMPTRSFSVNHRPAKVDA